MPRWSRSRGTAKNDAGRERPGSGFRHFTHQCFASKRHLGQRIALRQPIRRRTMHDLPLLSTLAGSLAAALVFGWVTQRLGLSTLVGYMLAGVLVGPYTPGFVADADLATQMAEIGVILLMFGVGMHFHPQELLRVWRIAVPGAIAQSAVATLAGWACARWFGWSNAAGFVFGMALAVASTVVLMRMLVDQDSAEHARRARRRRLADRRGPVHRHRARRAAGARRRRRGARAVRNAVAGRARQGRGVRAAGLVRRQPRRVAGPGAHGENPFGGTVHADRVRRRARHRRDRGAGLPRVGGAGRLLRRAWWSASRASARRRRAS